ncbi:hypothetical protein Glove_95g24 [Diversispora epigaea]|uniref:C2H2-type domain-containing protein n=1 Tax=Diversispora epigaea TaxID=1348612 RepID=A0A397JFF9_9GLOM|nr:hypothetical protein Glove_95g24 [Diversispora epigaea]
MPHATEPSNPSNPNGSIAMTSSPIPPIQISGSSTNNMPEYIVAAVNNANNTNNASNAAQVFYTADQNAMVPQQFLPYRQDYTCCGEDRVNLHDLLQHIDTVHPNLFVDSTYGIMSFDTSTIYSQSVSPSAIPVSFLEAPSFPNVSIQKDHQLTEEERNNQMSQFMNKWFGDIGQSDDLSQPRDDESCNMLPGALRDPKTATPFLGPTALSDNDLLAMKAKANNKNDDDFYLTSPYSPSSPLDFRDAPTPLDLRDALDAPSPLDLIPALGMENQEMTSLSSSSVNNAATVSTASSSNTSSVTISSTVNSPNNGATGSSITSLNYSTSPTNIRSNVSYSTTSNDGSNVSYSTSPSTTPNNVSVGQCQSPNTSVAVSYSIDQSQSPITLNNGVTASPIASLTTNFNLIDQNQSSAIFNTAAATTASSTTRVNSIGQSQSSVTPNAVVNAARFDHQSPMTFNKVANASSAARFGHVPLNARLRQYQSPVAFNTGATDQRQYSIVDNTAVSATSSRGIQTSQYRPSNSVVATVFTSPRVTMEQIHRAPVNRNTTTSSTASVNTMDQRNTTATANSSTANINAMYQRQSSITGTTSSRLNLMGQRQSNNPLTERILNQRQTAFTAGRINQRLYSTTATSTTINNGATVPSAIINNSAATTINNGTTAISATINGGTTTTATINQCPPSMNDLQNNMNQQQSSYGSLTIPTFLSDNSSPQQTTYSPTNNSNATSYTNYYQANSNSLPAAATTEVTLGNNSLTSVDNTVDGYTGRPGLRSGHSSSFVVARYPPIQPKSDISVSMADVYTDPSLGYPGGPSQGNKRASTSSEDPRPNKKRAKAPVPLSADSREDTDMYPYKCPVPGCPKAYKNANGLKYHNEHGHVPQSSDGGRPKPWPCPVHGCQKTYGSKGGLVYHVHHSHPSDLWALP